MYAAVPRVTAGPDVVEASEPGVAFERVNYIKTRSVILTVVSMIDQNSAGVVLPIPLPADRIFRNQAMDDILELLYRNPHDEFGVRQLRSITGHGAQTVDTALNLFSQLGVINTRREGNRKLVSINRDRVLKPEDPVLAIPQEQFRTPVHTFFNELREQLDTLAGVILFGSVARGEADRTSDIDLWILVEDDLLPSRRAAHEVRQDMSEKKFDESRYEFQVMVESVDSAQQYGEKLREIFSEGITLHSSERLDTVRRGVLHGE